MSYQSSADYPADNAYPDGEAYDEAGQAEASEQSGLFLRRAYNIARNRLGWTITFAVVLGAAGLALGLLLWSPEYQSMTVLSVEPTQPEVIGPSAQNRIPAVFSGFIQKQQTLLTGATTKSMATQTQAWADLERKKGHEVDFPLKVSAQAAPKGYTIALRVQAADPAVASTAANALVTAYRQRFSESKANQHSVLFRERKQAQRDLQSSLDDLRKRKGELAGNSSVEQLQIAFQNHQEQMQDVRRRLNRLQGALSGQSAGGQEDPLKLSPDQIAKQDPQMSKLLEQRQSAGQKLQLRLAHFGPDHPAVRSARRMKKVLSDQIQQRAEEFRNGQLAFDTTNEDDRIAQIGEAKDRVKNLSKQYEELQNQVSSEATQLGKIGDLTAAQSEVRDDLTQVKQKIDSMQREDLPTDRIQVVNGAIKPKKPSNGKDLVIFGIGGGLLGIFLGTAIVVMIGLYDHRMQRFADAETDLGEVRILGGLPTLPEDLTDPEQAERTSLAIHHIRTLLQIGRRDRGSTYSVASGSPNDDDSPIIYVGGMPRVYSVSSASPGAGKSSLALALGLSYVTGDSRTLLIDADIIGGGLTRRIFGDENRPQRGLLDGGSSSTQLPELVVRPEGLRGLDFLPIGGARPEDAGIISLRMVRRIIAQARERYDVVLVDTGPVMGSTEASMFATEADATIFVLARGDERKTVVRAIDHIRQVGGVLAGVVFNHALLGDLQKSSYGSMMSGSRSIPPAQLSGDPQRYARFGPIGHAVASHGPLIHGNGHGNGNGESL